MPVGKTVKDFFVADISVLRGANPVAVVERMYQIAKAVRGDIVDFIDPEDKDIRLAIVRDAEKLESPFHAIFEWNDRIAGTAYRLLQARKLIKSIRCVVEKEGGGEIEIVATVKHEPRPSIVPSPNRSPQQKKRDRLSQAITDLLNWCERYDDLSEFDTFRITVEEYIQDIMEVKGARTKTEVQMV